MRYCRNSAASFFSFAGVSVRRSAGEPIEVSSGYGVAEPMGSEFTVKSSVLSEHQPVGNARQRRCARPENRKRRQSARMQLVHPPARHFHADTRWIRCLVVSAVRAGGLTEQRGVAFDVQQVVLDLECQADGARELVERAFRSEEHTSELQS